MNSKSGARLFYCGMVNTSRYAARVGTSLFIGAGSKKMCSIVHALRSVGAKAFLVSMPVLGRESPIKSATAAVVRDIQGPQIFMPTVANRYFRKLLAAFYFSVFCASTVRYKDRVILYNHSLEYVLGLLILRMRGNPAILDIEDSPRDDEGGLRGFAGKLLFRIFVRSTRERKMIVSVSLAQMLGLREYCVVYGATRFEFGSNDDRVKTIWGGGDSSTPLRILFGGSLSLDTGVDLFCGAVALLIGSSRISSIAIDFVVTGFGAEVNIRELERRCAGSKVRILYYPNLSPEEYLQQLRSCHAALSLKIPDSPISTTTFPSKVVEITSEGLLLIATKASDVGVLFDESNSVLLHEVSSEALANAIIGVAVNPLRMAQIASQGKKRAAELFNSEQVGHRIAKDLIFDII